MARAKTTNKTASRISEKVEDRIVGLSLQNPDFGARRLVSLLKQKKISVSSSRIYGILKRHGLQTREKRLAKLAQQAPKKAKSTPGKPSRQISDEIAEQIVAVSLQNPDFGAKRLMLLLKDSGIDVSASKVYTLLKRHGLQTRVLRLSRIELQRLAEAPPPEVETPVPDAVPIPETQEEPEQTPEDSFGVLKAPPAVPVPSAPVKSPRRARWLFYLVDLCLLALVGYLGYHAVLNFRQARPEPEAVALVKPATMLAAVQAQIAVQPLKGYHKIWERNLFNIKEEKAATAAKEIPIEKIALAEKSIGLKLLGTVLSDDATLSRAIVHNQKTREQEAYREGDQAGEVKIKKIMRSKVVITTEKGDQLLTIDDEDFERSGGARSNQRRAPMSLASPRPTAAEIEFRSSGSALSGRRARSINLKREEVEASLADTDRLMQELKVSPFMQDDQPAGFIISNIPRESVLTRMGLRNGYVVTQINDQAITSPDQASEFFRTLAQGGAVSIQIRRSRGVRRRSQKIDLNIE
jgi:type II secretion system protein C